MINIVYNTLALYYMFHLRALHSIMSSDFTLYNVYMFMYIH